MNGRSFQRIRTVGDHISTRAAALACTALIATLSLATPAQARGVSPYIPLNVSPEIERDITRALLLAGYPVVRRPIAAATVLDALPDTCKLDAVLCERVRRYLDTYMNRRALTHASVEGAATQESDKTLPNTRGMSAGDEWNASIQALYQLTDNALVQVGAVAFPDEADFTGSWLSVGWDFAQFDIGYRDHAWSPMTDSSMLIGTQAETMPSVTVSNYQPLWGWRFQYEMFMGKMTRFDDIAFEGGTTSGHPSLGGLQVSFEPVRGWSLGASRVLQFGGGARDSSFSDFLNAFFQPGKYDNASEDLTPDDEFGNQAAALFSKFVFPARRPFAVYFEYAGEDGSRREGWRLGNVSLSAGIDIPSLWNRFDVTYEFSDWQNSWYVSHIYPDGLSNNGNVIGHWGADDRVLHDAVGAQSHMLRVGWAPPFGGLLEFRYRTLANEDYSPNDYEREHEVGLRYSLAWDRYVFGAEIEAGRDVFGEDFGRVGAFVRFAPGVVGLGSGSFEPLPDNVARNTEIFVDGGVNTSRLEFDPSDKGATPQREVTTSGAHVALGVRRAVTDRSDIGTRVEFDTVDGLTMLGVRAIDYRYRLGEKAALGVFVGAARYDAATAAYGYYGGIGATWRNIVRGIDLNLDLKATDKMARDAVLPEDPASVWGDVIYNISSAQLYLTYKFR